MLSQNPYQNRSFKYGDGLFETLRLVDGAVQFLERHFLRLQKGAAILGIELPKGFNQNSFQNLIINSLLAQNIDANSSSNWRVRITCYRAGEGLYTPQSNQAAWAVEATPLANPQFELNKEGLNIGICPEPLLGYNILSPIKSCNALAYVLAARYRVENNWDDCLLLNHQHRIAEATASNIFILKGTQLFSPSLEEACVEGVIRGLIKELAPQMGLEWIEGPLDYRLLEGATECWLSNAVYGIRWVKSIHGIPSPSYQNTFASKMQEALNRS